MNSNLGENVMTSLSRRIHNYGSIIDVIDPLFSTQAMLATTKAGMWRRNGAAVEGQMYIYHSPHLGPYQKRNDLLMMQVRLPGINFKNKEKLC